VVHSPLDNVGGPAVKQCVSLINVRPTATDADADADQITQPVTRDRLPRLSYTQSQ